VLQGFPLVRRGDVNKALANAVLNLPER